MKKILYISVNSKPECESSSKTVARELINEVLYQAKCKASKSKNTDVADECRNHNHEVSDYKKDEKCCHEHKDDHLECHNEYDKCCKESQDKSCTELKDNVKCNEELKASENHKDLPIKEYNVETVETKLKHKADVCCEDINEFIKDCCPDNDKHDDDKCCNDEHKHHEDSECCDHDHTDHHECCHTRKHEECDGFVIEEVDLYKDYIPILTHEFYQCRNTLVEGPGPCYDTLTHVQRRDMERIKELANQFKEADIYIIAAPMWSLLFPAPLKQYLDCVILNGVTAEINERGCKGLLDDKERKMVFVQSVGAELPLIIKGKLDHSNAYLKDISKFLGISKYTELLVDGTGYKEYERQEAMREAIKDVPYIAKSLIK